MEKVIKDPEKNDQPPILKSWKQLYWITLIIHALIITAFYCFTEFYK